MMRTLTLKVLVSLMSCMSAALPAVADKTAPYDLAIVGGSVWDASLERPRADSVILIKDGRIADVIERAAFAAGSAKREFDAKGLFVMPALSDMHTHVTMNQRAPSGTSAQAQMTAVHDDAAARYMLKELRRWGITHIRDTAGFVPHLRKLRDGVLGGTVEGPKIFFAGELIDSTPASFTNMSVTVTTAAAARAEVNRQADSGVDFIKTYASMTPELLKTVVEAAHGRGLRVISHLGATSWQQAADLGVDQFLHAEPTVDPGRYLQDPDARPLPELLAAMKAKRIAVDPTLVVFAVDVPAFRKEIPADLLAKVPALTREGWDKERVMLEQALGPQLAIVQVLFDAAARRFARDAAAAGVEILVGSDTPNPNVLPGYGLHQEMELLVSAGMSPRHVLTQATRGAALWLRKDRDFGLIGQGMEADLLVLEKSPLDDITQTRRIRAVFDDGREVPLNPPG